LCCDIVPLLRRLVDTYEATRVAGRYVLDLLLACVWVSLGQPRFLQDASRREQGSTRYRGNAVWEQGIEFPCALPASRACHSNPVPKTPVRGGSSR
jgi:hypothetical protein